MHLREARWLAEEAQCRTRGLVRSQRGGNAVLSISYDRPGLTEGGRRTPEVAEAEAKREVGANSEEVK